MTQVKPTKKNKNHTKHQHSQLLPPEATKKTKKNMFDSLGLTVGSVGSDSWVCLPWVCFSGDMLFLGVTTLGSLGPLELFCFVLFS